MTGVMFNINYQYLHDIFGRYLLADPGSAYLFVDDLFPIRIMIFILSRNSPYYIYLSLNFFFYILKS